MTSFHLNLAKEKSFRPLVSNHLETNGRKLSRYHRNLRLPHDSRLDKYPGIAPGRLRKISVASAPVALRPGS